MQSLNDLIWNDEDEATINAIDPGMLVQVCMLAGCTVVGKPQTLCGWPGSKPMSLNLACDC